MRFSLSKRSETTNRRYLLLDMTLQEESEVIWVIKREVLSSKDKEPKRIIRNDGTIRYRFNRKHLERLVLAFPFADMAPSVRRSFYRHSEVEWEDVDLEVPEFNGDLRNYQKVGVQAILDNWLLHFSKAGVHKSGGFMLLDEMGLGKTIMALAAILKELAVPALVVCPNTAKWSAWLRAVAQFTELEGVVADGTVAERVEAIEQRADITMVNIEMLQKREYVDALASFRYEAIVTDEFHRFANPTTKQTEGWMQLDGRRQLLMSGTPILGMPEQSWSGLHRLYPRRYPSHWAFKRWLAITKTIERHVKVIDPKTGRERIKHSKYTKVVGYKPEAMMALRAHVNHPSVSIRRRKDQVLPDLPRVVPMRLDVELTPEQWKLYNQIVDEMRLKLSNGEIKTIAHMMVQVMRAKQACFSPELYGGSKTSAKLDELEKIVEQLVASGQKALIFSQWKTATRIIERRLIDHNPAYVDGTVKGKLRRFQEDRFNQDPSCHLYIGTIRANNTAISLPAATYVIFTDRDWVPMVNDQARDRSASGGLRGAHLTAEDSITEIEIFARNTVEERIEGVLRAKSNTFNTLYEKDGGKTVDRTTVKEIADLF